MSHLWSPNIRCAYRILKIPSLLPILNQMDLVRVLKPDIKNGNFPKNL
jgi:hypothetical protein